MHKQRPRPNNYCTKCRVGFASPSALEDHYRGKDRHPNCPRCHKGFFDDNVLNEHLTSAHPTVTCCGYALYEEDLPAHYIHSDRHPTCKVCGIGLKDDEAHAGHNEREHPELRCNECSRYFDSPQEMATHFDVSPLHPKCSVCGRGVPDDAALAQHHLAAHNRLPPPSDRNNRLWGDLENALVPHALPSTHMVRPFPNSSDFNCRMDIGDAEIGDGLLDRICARPEVRRCWRHTENRS
ncbi:hypothetical protein FB45DRAFT_841981 [Roridomyces roridus]|uniref:C2H2-type domain-containing protein n=1 Tax=Roridomyces roridus TaxID=1738132 RepID=A0AAD7FEI0_9AGAR|nr:hypothetical protein FB45DRAFT_841981 [Roridomyces roridus]